jgi:hypothetical protein
MLRRVCTLMGRPQVAPTIGRRWVREGGRMSLSCTAASRGRSRQCCNRPRPGSWAHISESRCRNSPAWNRKQVGSRFPSDSSFVRRREACRKSRCSHYSPHSTPRPRTTLRRTRYRKTDRRRPWPYKSRWAQRSRMRLKRTQRRLRCNRLRQESLPQNWRWPCTCLGNTTCCLLDKPCRCNLQKRIPSRCSKHRRP